MPIPTQHPAVKNSIGQAGPLTDESAEKLIESLQKSGFLDGFGQAVAHTLIRLIHENYELRGRIADLERQLPEEREPEWQYKKPEVEQEAA